MFKPSPRLAPLCVLISVITTIGTATATASLTPSTVFARLSDRYTETQREAYFDSVKGQHVTWTMRVTDVSKGWWNFDISGTADGGGDMLCKVPISDDSTRLTASLGKGTRVVCQGKLRNYVRFAGVLVSIEDATLQLP